MSVPHIKPGEAISAAMLNKIVDLVVKRLRGGKGITVKRMGENVIVTGVGAGGTAQSTAYIYTGDTRDDLPTSGVPQGSIGVTTGVDKRAYVFVDTSWICTSHLEDPA